MQSADRKELRWGILGTGKISSRFVSDLLLETASGPKHHVSAIGSSSLAKGRAFTERHGILHTSRVYEDYASIYADADVDIVYVGTPHSCHRTNTLDAIRAGKHVLCEKPLAMNAREASEMIEAAREKKVFLMEGVWTRFFDLAKQVQILLHEKHIIGRINRVFVDFALDQKLDSLPPDSRLINPRLGAGALLDIGVYTLMWGLLLFERTSSVHSEQNLQSSSSVPLASPEDLSIMASSVIREGMDVSTALVLTSSSNDCQAVMTSTLLTKASGQTFARVYGTKGCIAIDGNAASKPDSFTIKLNDSGETVTHKFERVGYGLRCEADAVALDIFSGNLESKIMPLEESLAVMRFLDSVREAVGLHYPQDQES